MKKILLIILQLFIATNTYAQVGIGNTDPKATLEVSGNPTSTTTPDGIIAPKISGDQLKAKDAIYTIDQKGTIIYATSAPTPTSTKTANVTQEGYYYFDGTLWKKFTGNSGGFNHYLGEDYLDGIIFYLYKGSDGLEHELVVSKVQNNNVNWQPQLYTVTSANRTEDGIYNTALMPSNSGAKNYVTSLGTGWYLPSIDELVLLFNNRFTVQKALRSGGFTLISNFYYWSSTETDLNYAFTLYTTSGEITLDPKGYNLIARGIKAF